MSFECLAIRFSHFRIVLFKAKIGGGGGTVVVACCLLVAFSDVPARD